MSGNYSSFFFFKGRVALYAILKTMGIKTGDEVILSGFTCVAVSNSIAYFGAKPVYVDIDLATYNIDPSKIEEKITERTKVIIAQHTFGIPAEMDKILEIAIKYNLYVIEDSCHALGSKYKGKEVGTFGDAAFFSSQWSKPVTTGLGGWAIINNPDLKEKMEKIYPEFIKPSFKETLLLRMQYLAYSLLLKPSLFWLIQDLYRRLSRWGIVIASSSNEELECKLPEGYEKKMSSWQEKLLKIKLEKINQSIEHRMHITSLYEKLLTENAIKTVQLPDYYEIVFLRYPVIVKDKKKALEAAKKSKLELGDWFLSPLCQHMKG
ncbi:MAG: DegT/DnrJ/EryC1/StrS family aminotransferase [Candidatus Omnitrophica bacterium]|nr:DegT/DnrJ/EryC1/StrS family aminotransferase [Candidatus Omnitrophota bacterium]